MSFPFHHSLRGWLKTALPAGALLFLAVSPPAFAQENGPDPAIVVKTASEVPSLPVNVAPNAPELVYSGRWDTTNTQAPEASWSASGVTLRFSGTAVQTRLRLGNNRVIAVLDGKPILKLAPDAAKKTAGAALFVLAKNLPPGEHTLQLVKATEANQGRIAFEGFWLDGTGKALPATAPSRLIEIIGDSISAGYGNEGLSQADRFSPETENAYRTYGAMTARRFGADYNIIAWSGRTLWPTFTLPEVYNQVAPPKAEPAFAGFARQPDAILINLSTNDFNRKENPEEEPWVAAYHAFLDRLQQWAPNAHYYLAASPMLSDGWPAGRKTRSTSIGYIQRVVRERQEKGQTRVHYLEFATQSQANGLGSDWHPSIKTHALMAEVFTAALAKDLGWQPLPAR